MDNNTQFNFAPQTLIPAVVAAEIEAQVPEAKPETAKADPTTELSSFENGLRDFHSMGDAELIEAVRDVARKYTTFRECFRVHAPATERLHKEYAKKGQRLPIEGGTHVGRVRDGQFWCLGPLASEAAQSP